MGFGGFETVSGGVGIAALMVDAFEEVVDLESSYDQKVVDMVEKVD